MSDWRRRVDTINFIDGMQKVELSLHQGPNTIVEQFGSHSFPQPARIQLTWMIPSHDSVLGCPLSCLQQAAGCISHTVETVAHRSRGSRVAWLAEPRWLSCLYRRPRGRPLSGPANHSRSQPVARAFHSVPQAPPAAASLRLPLPPPPQSPSSRP